MAQTARKGRPRAGRTDILIRVRLEDTAEMRRGLGLLMADMGSRSLSETASLVVAAAAIQAWGEVENRERDGAETDD